MKSYDEIAKNVFQRRDEYEEKKYHREAVHGHAHIVFYAAVLMAILILSAWAGASVLRPDPEEFTALEDPTVTGEEETSTDTPPVIVEETTYYRVTENGGLYGYVVFDKNGNTVRTEENLTRQPSFEILDDGFLQIRTQAGTGIATSACVYYDIENDVFSEVFPCVFDEYNGRVVYVTDNKVIVQDILDKNVFYLEISSFREEFAPVAFPFRDVEFINDGASICVKYRAGSDYADQTEYFGMDGRSEIWRELSEGFIPLEEIGESYPGECIEEAGGTLMFRGNVSSHFSVEAFEKFLAGCNSGEVSYIRIGDYNPTEEIKRIIYDLVYDGETYIIRWLDNGTEIIKEYKYMMHYTGQQDSEWGAFDYYERYVLTNEETPTWEQILSSGTDHCVVYCDLTTEPWRPEIPENLTKAVLEYEGQEYITITDQETLRNLYDLYRNFGRIDYTVETHNIGLGLNLVLTDENGETLTIELDYMYECCMIDGEFYDYCAYDDLYMEKLWEYLGITQWPMEF